MICFRLDKALLSFARNSRCIYTRYADDITFSSHQGLKVLFEGSLPSPGHFLPETLAPTLLTIFANNGFTLNDDKAHYADRHSRRMVTGIKVNQLLNVDRRFVRNIRAALYSIETLGEKDAQEKFEKVHGGSANIRSHLQGKISWLGYIRSQSDPVFRSLAVRFNKIFPGNEIKVVPTGNEIRDRAVWVVEHFEGDMAQGTAFFLKGIGLVTAAHCVEGATETEVYHPTKPSNKFTTNVLKLDKSRDLAILEHEIPDTEYFELTISTSEVALGDGLTAVGYPQFGPGDKQNVRGGMVSSLPIKSAVQMIEVTQKLTQGMSGGPLLDSEDTVVGIIHKGGPEEGRDFAVHYKCVKRLAFILNI